MISNEFLVFKRLITRNKKLRCQLEFKLFPYMQGLVRRLDYFPAGVFIEPTNRCNLRCVFCLRGSMTRKIGCMSLAEFKEIVDRTPTLKVVSLYFMGEPFLNPSIFDMISYAENVGISTAVSTNSSMLYLYVDQTIECGLSRLVLSLDGMSQQTIEKYRVNCDFNDTVKGIESICQEKLRLGKSKPFVKIRFLVFKHNEHEIPKVIEFARRNHIDELVLVRPILDWGHTSLPESSKDWLSTDEKYRRYKNESLNNPLKWCTWIWTPVVTWEGDVLPCCYDANGEIVLGNVFEQSLEDIYWSGTYKQIREKMARRRLSFCRMCKQIETPEIEHYRFTKAE